MISFIGVHIFVIFWLEQSILVFNCTPALHACLAARLLCRCLCLSRLCLQVRSVSISCPLCFYVAHSISCALSGEGLLPIPWTLLY